jgi:hypothetical protein|nr:MAG TPA: hypothetical protein [Crassvirales sp.]
MANYSLVINSKFQPFSFERYIQPLQMYGAAFREQQDALSEIDTKASVWEKLANEQPDSETSRQYKAFADDLHKQAESISKYGINTSSRQAMLDMRSRYAKEITPIEQAYNKRAADIVRQQKLSDATGGKTVFTRTAATTSLDDYRKGIEDFGQANLDQIMQESAAGAKAMSARIFNREEVKNAFDGDYYALIQRQGLSPEQAAEVLAGSGKYPEFTKYINDTKSKYNINAYDKKSQERINSAIIQGINAGMVYQENYTPVNNWRAQSDNTFQHQLELQNNDLENKAKLAQLSGANANGVAINPLNIYSAAEKTAEENAYNNNIRNFSKYFYTKNGKTHLTWAGLQEYRRNAASKEIKAGLDPIPSAVVTDEIKKQQQKNNFEPTAFKKFMDSIGGSTSMSGNTWNSERLGSLWQNYYKNNLAAKTTAYDAKKVTEFDYALDNTQNTDMKNAIMTAARGGTLKEVDYDPKTGQFKKTGKSLSLDDLDKKETVITSTRFSTYGNTVMIKDEDGEVKRYEMPAGINTRNEQNRNTALKEADQWLKVKNSGKFKGNDGKEHIANQDELAYIQKKYEEALNRAYMYHSQIGITNKTKPQEFNPYAY